MKEALKKIGSNIAKTVKGAAQICRKGYAKLAIFMTCWVSPMAVHASTFQPDESQVNDAIGGILAMFSWAFAVLGIFLLVYALVHIIGGFRNEDSERQQKGIISGVVAILLIANKPIINGILGMLDAPVSIGDNPLFG